MAHVGPGLAGPPPLGPEGFDWTSWQADPGVVAGLVVLGAAYTAATLWRRRLAPEARVEPLKVVSFGGALLLLYGTPGFMLRPLVRDAKLRRLGRALTRPVGAFATFNVILIAWHLPPLYNLAMDQHPFHILGHLLMMAGSVILWWPVLSPLDELPRAPYPIQMLYLFVVGLPMVMVAIFISMADSLLYPYYAAAPRIWPQLTPRADQHLGGLIMWIPGGMVFLVALSVVFFRWQSAGGDDLAVPLAGARHGR